MKPKRLAGILLVLCFLMTAVPAYAAQFSYSDLNEYRHIIQNEVLNDYKGRVFFAVDVDAQAVRVYADSGDRNAITAALKRYGINMNMVIIEGQARETSAAGATANVNIRSGPGRSYKKLGTLNKGQSISVIKITNKWAQFIWNDTVAYVHSDYIKYGNAVLTNPAGEPVVVTVGADESGIVIATATGKTYCYVRIIAMVLHIVRQHAGAASTNSGVKGLRHVIDCRVIIFQLVAVYCHLQLRHAFNIGIFDILQACSRSKNLLHFGRISHKLVHITALKLYLYR